MEMAQVKTVLVVDDTLVVLSLVAAIVESGNHIPLTASSYQEALSISEQSINLDVLITDIRMPGMNGFELARIIRDTRPGLPILFISGDFDSEENEHLEWLQKPNVAFLPKPFSPSSLLENLDAVLAPA